MSVVSAWAKGLAEEAWEEGRGLGRGIINLVNEGSGDYALRLASNRDETGIRVGPSKRTIRAHMGVDKGEIVKGRAALDRWLLERAWFQNSNTRKRVI